MIERDDAILKHLGKYGVSLRHVIEKRFFDGATCDHVLNRLIRENRVVAEVGIPGGLSYYHLSLSEARGRGVPEHRARPKRGAALREALQVLQFCCLSKKKRNRLERRDIGKNFGNGKGSGKPHCAEVDGDRSIIYRVYAPGPNSKDDYLLKTLRIDLEVAARVPELQEWIENGAFGFAVLVETPERKARLLRLIAKHGPRRVPIVIEVVAGLSTLASTIRIEKGDEHHASR
ncbi:hypothetical protein F183_A21080 [Bryobacterales bacterium F-183]|nr:hypothetical protein F183_A21080 [Bryobacterales bacterium F-183]